MTRLRIYRACPECGFVGIRLGGHKTATNHNIAGAKVVSWENVHNYQSAHKVVRAVRGPASAQPCAQCGDAALDWSFQGGRAYGEATWSADVQAYEPLCRKCHWSFDGREDLDRTLAKRKEALENHRLDPDFDKEYRDSKSRAAVLGNKSPKRKKGK